MNIAFFISSAGDTDLAKATIAKLAEQQPQSILYLIPLTTIAEKRTQEYISKDGIHRVLFEEIISRKVNENDQPLTAEELESLSSFIEDKNLQHAYIGVPSAIDEEMPYQIASHLEINYTIAFEFMFKANNHPFWQHVGKLSSRSNCSIAVPLKAAANDIYQINSQANAHTVGHLSIDRALSSSTVESTATKKALNIGEQDELAFISGTTQPTEVDDQFLNVLLSELASGNYPNLQLRFGIHPCVKDLDRYLETLLATCAMYPKQSHQFKIILPDKLEQQLLNKEILDNPFLLRQNVSGPDAANAADKIAQAVPGALLNEAALRGMSSYFHSSSVIAYLPKDWFAESVSEFFTAKTQPAHSRAELELSDSAPALMAKLLI